MLFTMSATTPTVSEQSSNSGNVTPTTTTEATIENFENFEFWDPEKEESDDDIEVIGDALEEAVEQRKTPPSKGVTFQFEKENHPATKVGEALESEVMVTLREGLKSLPISLQQKVVEWTEILLGKRDQVQRKQGTLKNHMENKLPPASAISKWELTTTEYVKEVFKDEHTEMCDHVKAAKEQFSNLLKFFVTKTTDMEVTSLKYILVSELLKIGVKFNKSLICSLMADVSHNSKTTSLVNAKVQRLAECIVEEEMLENKTKMRECVGLELEDVIVICRKDVKQENADRKVRDLDVLKKGLGECENDGTENDDIENEEVEKGSEDIDEGATANFDFSAFVPKNLFTLSNVESGDDWRKMRDKELTIENKFNLTETMKEAKTKHVELFKIMTIETWNGKVEEGMESVQNAVCQQTLELDETIETGRATSAGIQKEKFVPKRTAGKIAREEAHEQCKRDMTRLKNETKKEIEKSVNKKINNESKNRNKWNKNAKKINNEAKSKDKIDEVNEKTGNEQENTKEMNENDANEPKEGKLKGKDAETVENTENTGNQETNNDENARHENSRAVPCQKDDHRNNCDDRSNYHRNGSVSNIPGHQRHNGRWEPCRRP